MQAQDDRFCNAGVEFDLKTLRPTYRLTWQSVGASNALAVAEGLGFDPLVIQEARKVRRLLWNCLLWSYPLEIGCGQPRAPQTLTIRWSTSTHAAFPVNC